MIGLCRSHYFERDPDAPKGHVSEERLGVMFQGRVQDILLSVRKRNVSRDKILFTKNLKIHHYFFRKSFGQRSSLA